MPRTKPTKGSTEGRTADVADNALADLQRQRVAYEERRQVIAGSDLPITPERHPKEHPWPADYLDALCKPVRVIVSFDDLPRCAKQIRILSTAASHARAVLYDVARSQQRKRLDLRFIMKQAAGEIAEAAKGKQHRANKRREA